jgi:hypothetical protein
MVLDQWSLQPDHDKPMRYMLEADCDFSCGHTLILVATMLTVLCLGYGTAGCEHRYVSDPCEIDADCLPGALCQTEWRDLGCQVEYCRLEGMPCRDDLVCYLDPEEHPFPDFASRNISGARGVCYYSPDDPRIPDYDEEAES